MPTIATPVPDRTTVSDRTIIPDARLALPQRQPGPIRACLLSCLLPGAGQLYSGQRRRGALFIVVAGLVGVAVAWALVREWDHLPSLLVRPQILLAILAANAAVLVFRVAVAADALWSARRVGSTTERRGGLRSGAGATAMVLVLAVVAAPHLLLGWYNLEAYRVLTTVFRDEWATTEATPLTGPIPSEEGKIEGEPKAPSALTAQRRWPFLLVGADSGPGRWGVRADTVMVVTVVPGGRRAALFGVPRNLVGVPIPGAAPEGSAEPVYAIYAFGRSHPELFPGRDPGATALKRAVGDLIGIRIDHYVMVDMQGFVQVIDALGGVTIDLRTGLSGRFSPPGEEEAWVHIELPPGRHHVDGTTALAYARVRGGSSDYDRMARQRCLLANLVGEARIPRLLRSLPELARIIRRNVQTDIPLRLLPELLALVPEIPAHRIVTQAFVPPEFVAGWNPDGYPIADRQAIRTAVEEALRRPPGRSGKTGTLDQACPSP